jgi:DNA invertase Pin-like site-specific DNA recombinase
MQTLIYTRLSEDRDGQQTATARQEADCRKLAAERGWEISRVYEDVDISAYDRRKKRPQFEQMLADVAADGGRILVWKLDRLIRQPRDTERVLDILEGSGGQLASVNDPVDTSTPMGQAMFRIGVVMAHAESSNISIRQKSKQAEIAAQGRAAGGGWRCCGYTKDRSELVPEEADRIRDAARRLIAGESARGIIRQWNEEGFTTTTGGQWVQQPFTRMMKSATIAGLRAHKGVIVADAVWPAIITREQHEKLTAVLDPARRRTTNGNPRRYLLAGGLLRCGVCGHILTARPREDGVRRYVCQKAPGLPGCGGIAIMAEPLEELIAEAVFAALDTPRLGELLAAQADSDEADERIRQIHEDGVALEELAQDYYTHRIIDRASFLAAKQTLEERIEQNHAQLGRTRATSTLAGLNGGDAVREAWAERDLTWRRSLFSLVLEHVTISRARRGYNKFDPDRVGIIWRA